MPPIAGKDGQFTLGSNAMAYIDNYNLTLNSGTAETNSLGKNYKEFIPTVKDWSGSASGTLDKTDPAQDAALTMMAGSGAVTVQSAEFALGSATLEGSVILTSISIGAAHGDKVTFSVNFQGTGVLAYDDGKVGG